MKTPHPDVQTYYNRTRFDYRVLWNRRRRDVAVHFGYYDEHADHHADALDNMNRVLADLADIQPGERVLDAGCGLGNACFWLAGRRGARVTGLNIVERQIIDCQNFKEKNGLTDVDFVQADFCSIPFGQGTFDVVWACESICHAAQKQAFYREAYRVLKPGGRLVMAEYMRTGRPLPANSERLLSAWLHPWAIPDIDTADEHRGHAQSAGFSEINIRDVTPNVRVSLRNLHEISTRWLPLGRFFGFFGIVDRVRLGNARASVRQYDALQAGAWKYGLLLAEKR
ncbi:MAG: methyltransferase domain-containing protein [Lewinellaceae bacterium]|nr:methyltransferase domain-containing protein [Lewinellaceae bacterium]